MSIKYLIDYDIFGGGKCEKSTLKKYDSRPSPPFPANDYCNQTKKGNDGNMYISKPNKNNICSWKMV